MRILGLKVLSILFFSKFTTKTPFLVNKVELQQRSNMELKAANLDSGVHIEKRKLFNGVDSVIRSPTLIYDEWLSNISKSWLLAALLASLSGLVVNQLRPFPVMSKTVNPRIADTPNQMTRYDYIDRILGYGDARNYKASGVLLYRRNRTTGKMEFLVGRNSDSGLDILGGKIEHTDKNVIDTAVREFNEETSFLLDPKLVASLQKGLNESWSAELMWYSQGKYVLHLLPVESVSGLYEATDRLPKLMKELRRDKERWSELPRHCRELCGLVWTSLEEQEKMQRQHWKHSRFLQLIFKSKVFKLWLSNRGFTV